MNHSIDDTTNWLHLALIRDPIDRFVSSFVQRCLGRRSRNACSACRGNIACFIYNQYNRMIAYAKGIRLSVTFEDRAFFPQNWLVPSIYLYKRLMLVQ